MHLLCSVQNPRGKNGTTAELHALIVFYSKQTLVSPRLNEINCEVFDYNLNLVIVYKWVSLMDETSVMANNDSSL